MSSARFTIVMALIWLGGPIHDVYAQGAWVGDPQSLSADFSYQYVPSTAVVSTPDMEVPDRPTTNHVVTLSAEYAPIEDLAIEAALPLAMVKYSGTTPHTPAGAWDDGAYHTTLTDLRIGARYQVLAEPYVALSPHLAVTIPVMDYETVGLATGGRHLKQLHLGFSVGRTLDPYVPNLFMTGSYEFSLGEKYDATPETAEIKQKRSDIEAQIGYLFLEGALAIHFGGNWRMQHGGLAFEDFGTTLPVLIQHHDPLLDEDFIFAGGGASYAINPRMTVAAFVRFFVRGYNTRDQDLYGVQLTWNVL